VKVALHTHLRAGDTAEAVQKLVDAVRAAGGDVIARADERDKHPDAGLTVVEDPAREGIDVAVVSLSPTDCFDAELTEAWEAGVLESVLP